MAHELMRLREKLVNTPLLVDEDTYTSVVNYLNERNTGEIEIRLASGEGKSREEYRRFLYNEDTQTAVMYVEGPITNKPVTMWGFDCGGTSYVNLKEDVELAIQDGAKTIVWMADSGGGEALGMTDSAAYIRSLLDENGVKLLSYVEGRAASACYGLVAISDEIIASKDSELGSIGVLVQLINNSEALKMNGYERTFITAGDDKIPFDADGKFRDGFLADLQNKVDTCYKDFTEHVAKYRNLSVDAVKSTQAKMFFTSDAIELGLADKVMTPEEFYAYLADEAQRNMTTNSEDDMNRIFKFTKEEDSVKLAEMQTQLDAAVEAQTALQGELTAVQASFEAVTAEKAELAAALEAKDAALAELTAELAVMKQAQEDQKVAGRKAALEKVVAADRVDGLMASLESLTDEAFASVVEGFAASKAVIEQSDMMQELGQDSEEVKPSGEQAGNDATLAAIQRMTRK